MEIALPSQNRTIAVATLAVLVLGLTLSFSTWRNLRQQQDAFKEHALVTARSIAAGIEINLNRELHLPSLAGSSNAALLLRRTLARELLQDHIKRTDARFIGLFTHNGHILFSSHSDPKALQEQLPTIAWESMGTAGEWSGELNFEGQPLMVLGRLSPQSVDIINNVGQSFTESEPPLLLVGVDMAQHLAAFGKYKRTAILQTSYILAVTIIFWILLMGFLQRQEQSQRLHRLQSFNARLLDHMPDGLLTIATDGTIVAANPSALALVGSQTSVGQHWPSFLTSLGLDTPQQTDQEWTTYKSDGKHLEVLQLALKDGSGQSLVLIRDRTEMVRLEQELHRTEKLAAIGRMAAGVAHEIRNPLSALRGFAQFFSKKLAGQEPEELYAQTMVQEADRLNRVITDLLFLARPRQLELTHILLAEVFQEVHTLLSMDLKARHCVLTSDLHAPSLVADRDALKQTLINLLHNSIGAMPAAGGEIVLASQAETRGIWVTIEDNGQGMSAEDKEHALEPFFTTRDQGTGLGLAIVHTIMQEHKGSITIDSSPGQGTRISLFFPQTHLQES
jgi:signal transduction histidine kinase